MRDALRSYLQIASGLTEMTVHRVTEAAKQLVEKSGVDLDHVVPAQVAQQAQAVPQYVQQVADDLFATGKANRDLLVGVVRSEVDKAMGRLRPWTDDLRRVEDDLARAERRITELEHRLAVLSAPPRAARGHAVPVADPAEGADDEQPVPVPVRKPAARASAPVSAVPVDDEGEDAPFARRAVTPAKAAKRAAAKRAPAKTAPAKTAAGKTASGKPATTKPVAGKKAAAKAPAKKTAAGEGTGTGAARKKAAPAKPPAVSKPPVAPKPPASEGGSEA